MHHFPAVAARFRRRLGSQLKGSVVAHHNIMEPYRRRRRCLLSSPTTSSVPPASKPASHALPCPPSSSASVDGVGRDGVRRPAEERCGRLTQVVRQLQHTHPLSSQKEKACRIVTNHHQIDSSPRRVSRFTSTRHTSPRSSNELFSTSRSLRCIALHMSPNSQVPSYRSRTPCTHEPFAEPLLGANG